MKMNELKKAILERLQQLKDSESEDLLTINETDDEITRDMLIEHIKKIHARISELHIILSMMGE